MRRLAPFALPALSALAMAAALIEPRFALLGLAALVPFFWFLQLAKSRGAAFWGGWLYGAILWGFLAQWIFDLLPLDWTGLTERSALIFIAFSWLFTALLLGLVSALLALLLAPLLRKSAPAAILGGTVLWVAVEFGSSWLSTVIWMGAETTPYPITLGHVGYALANFPALLQLASFGTIYLLSAAVFLTNACLFVVLRGFAQEPRARLWQRSAPAIALVLAVFAGTAFDAPLLRGFGTSAGARPLRIALVVSNAPSWSEMPSEAVPLLKQNLSRLLEELGREELDLVVFPESSRINNLIEPAELAAWFKNSNAVILDNALRKNSAYPGSPFVSRLIAFRPRDGELIAYWDKSSLMMGGEYPPLILTVGAKLLGAEDVLRRLEKNAYRPGDGTEQPVRVGDHAISISLCTQAWAPQFFARQHRLGADILVNMSSDPLFHGSTLYAAERLAMLKVRAVENRSFLLHAANGNPSLVIGPEGTVRTIVPLPAPLTYSYRIVTLPD